MSQAPRRARIVRLSTAESTWEVATRPTCALLAPHVQELMGYLERAGAGLRRREYPVPGVVVIIDLGPPLRVRVGGSTPTLHEHRGGFVSGLDTRYAETEHDGVQHGIQLNLDPIGAARVFGIPLGELANQTVALADLVPKRHGNLSERLAELTSWDARFDVLEHVLQEQLRDNDAMRADIAWATSQLLAARGGSDMRELARQLGYSHKHMVTLFRTHVGLSPKLLSRLVRFDRMMRALKRGSSTPWAQLASELGYFDQAHLARDVREFAGSSPGSLRALVSPLGPLFDS